MKKRWIAIISLCTILVILGGSIFAYNIIQNFINQQMYGRGKILVPQTLDVSPTQLEWGSIRLTNFTTVGYSQTVKVTNKGLVPLRVQAFAVNNSVDPNWFNQDTHWILGWTADGYILGPHESIDTTFKLFILSYDVEEYMMRHGLVTQNMSEFEFSFDVKMEAGVYNGESTFVHYCSNYDYTAAKLIADNQSLELYRGLSKVLDVKDPSVYDPLYDVNNIIAVGGWITNPYVAYYFPEYSASNGKIVGGGGISVDGRRVVFTKTRTSGYNITAVFGYTKEDTYDAAKEYIGYVPPPKKQYFLTVTFAVNGTTTPSIGTYAYNEGSLASITANPNTGYQIDYWTLDGSDVGSQNPLTVTMNANHTVTCVFKVAPPITGPLMSIVPQNIIGTSVGSTITLNVTVLNVADLFTWQAVINYTSSILNCTSVYLPSDNIFAGQTIVPVQPIINNQAGSVMYGVSLMTGSFTGNGTLFQMQFKVLSKGQCPITFSTPYGVDTFFLDSNLLVITAQTTNGYFDNR